MNDTHWQDLVGRIKDTFPIIKEGEEELADEPGKREFVVFTGPAGEMRLERVTRPVVLGTHALTSKRIGATAAVTYDYSETESTQTVKLYRDNNGAWVEVDLNSVTGQA